MSTFVKSVKPSSLLPFALLQRQILMPTYLAAPRIYKPAPTDATDATRHDRDLRNWQINFVCSQRFSADSGTKVPTTNSNL